MRNIALILTYLGTDYHGWQVQKNLPTVAETLEKAAAMIVGHPVHMTGCGRRLLRFTRTSTPSAPVSARSIRIRSTILA